MAIKLIIGLRNPGQTYELTRHNAGGWLVEALSQHTRCVFATEKKMHAAIATITLGDLTCRAALPTTFMNHSGLPTRLISQFYRITPEEILVVHDELDLPVGHIKLKSGGGHGGHNGLRDIIAQLNSNHFHRLRVGIGHPGHKDNVLNYVLGKPSSEDKQQIHAAIERGIAVMPQLLAGNIASAMNSLHTDINNLKRSSTS